jgi:hypothetical protein
MEPNFALWIINQSGIPLFHRIDESVNPTLISSFLSAIQGMIKTSFPGSQLNKLIFGESQLLILPVKKLNIYLVVRCHKKLKERDVRESLEQIRDIFIARFQDRLKEPGFNVDEFQSFNADLNKLFGTSRVIHRLNDWLDEV